MSNLLFLSSSVFNAPLAIPDLEMWLDASDTSTITDSSGSVSAWADKSGNGNNATQGTGSAQPTTGLNTANGKNVLNFDGGDTLEVGSGVYSIPSDENTLFIVSRCTDTSVQRRPFVMTDGSNARYKMAYETKAGVASATEVVFQVDSNLDPLGAQASGTSDNYQVLTGTFDGTNATTVAINNDTEVSDTNGVAFTATNCFIGSQAGSAVFLIGDICEVVLYSRKLTTGEQNLIKAYLTNKWLGFRIPTDIEGLQAWYDTTSDDYLTLDGSAITQFIDRSGQGNDTDVQGTASARPTRTASQINGLQAAVFDGNDELDLPSALYSIPNGDNTIFLVAKQDTAASGTNERILSMNDAGSNRLYFQYASGSELLAYTNGLGGGDAALSSTTTTDFNIFTGQLSGTTETITANGSEDSGTAPNGVNFTAINATIGQGTFDGALVEVLIFDRALTSTEKDNINGYLSAKYNIGLA